jgi:hypothetical protein
MTYQALAPDQVAFDRRWDAAQYRFIFALSFVVFFCGTALMRLFPNHWGESHGRSILAQAWEASGTAAQIAFSG